MPNSLLTGLITDGFNMAVAARAAESVVHHRDGGSNHTSLAFGQRCADLGVRPSTGSVGDP